MKLLRIALCVGGIREQCDGRCHDAVRAVRQAATAPNTTIRTPRAPRVHTDANNVTCTTQLNTVDDPRRQRADR